MNNLHSFHAFVVGKMCKITRIGKENEANTFLVAFSKIQVYSIANEFKREGVYYV